LSFVFTSFSQLQEETVRSTCEYLYAQLFNALEWEKELVYRRQQEVCINGGQFLFHTPGWDVFHSAVFTTLLTLFHCGFHCVSISLFSVANELAYKLIRLKPTGHGF
jgi:hypothetical protein